MKKTYTIPMLIVGGDVVRETLGGDNMGSESIDQTVFRLDAPGNVGYYL